MPNQDEADLEVDPYRAFFALVMNLLLRWSSARKWILPILIESVERTLIICMTILYRKVYLTTNGRGRSESVSNKLQPTQPHDLIFIYHYQHTTFPSRFFSSLAQFLHKRLLSRFFSKKWKKIKVKTFKRLIIHRIPKQILVAVKTWRP